MSSDKSIRSGNFEIIDGFRCYAPRIARQGADYPLEGFDVTARVEERSFWCRSRNRIIRDVFNRFTDRSRRLDVLEIGCGIGGVIGELRTLSHLNLTGSEVYLRGLEYARGKFPDVEFIQLDATNVPFFAEFDAIGAFDVLEHIELDERVMGEVFRALRPGGMFFVTVPQHQWLWSGLDEIVHHKRRYSRQDLISKMKTAGFDVLFVSSFVTTLFPFMLLSRVLNRPRPAAAAEVEREFSGQVDLPESLNRFFDVVMRLDEVALRTQLSLPFGGSLLAVAQRADATPNALVPQ